MSEPLAWRVGADGDLSYAYDNNMAKRAGLNPAEPMTPLLRAYENDNVQVRILVGAHTFAHQFNLEGPTWFAEPSWKNSGYRSAQPMGLSEHFELLFGTPHGVDLAALASMHGLEADRVEKAGEVVPAVEAAITAGGVRFVIVPTERAENVRRHREAWRAVASSLPRTGS